MLKIKKKKNNLLSEKHWKIKILLIKVVIIATMIKENKYFYAMK